MIELCYYMFGLRNIRFNRVHKKVLSAIAVDYVRGHELYVKNSGLYDALPVDPSDSSGGRLARKTEVHEAVRGATGVINTYLYTLESVDNFTELMVSASELLKQKNDISPRRSLATSQSL